MRRLLGVDLGERRIGLAIADADGTPARPLATIRRGSSVEADVAVLAPVVDREGVVELVVGLPLHLHGDEGSQAALSRAWAESIAARFGLPLTLRDERLSSHRAAERVGPMKRGRSGGPPTPTQREAYRSRIDREAAAIILQDEIEDRRSSGGRPAPPVHGSGQLNHSEERRG